ncbi:class I adenylate-forming enzyme family protein [Nocardioides sp. T2.26MG-1]|uniref:class I adenylate-forming enzyme family protein n=1 Tax=Nocardioides sp. T2.26MG-1 TaxID=3041166 RepID=UPI0024774D44|nr:class I adenylate-forming enzyme family protein [Nocardioides sp. T2.26MG-1]CAI9410748.1 Long-chain-fatty-acid--CoA ligase FadD13 [Nocardioides sp. T2.26MG-1]
MYQEALGQTVNRTFDYTCDEGGDREALVYHGPDVEERLSYFQLRRRVAALADGLQQAGVRKGDRVAFLLGVTTEWVTVFYAAMRLGAIAVPLNLVWTAREIEEGLSLTEANVLIATDSFRGRNYLHELQEHLPGLNASKPGELSIETLPHLRSVIAESRSGERYAFAGDLGDIARSGENYSAEGFAALSAEVRPDDFSIMLLTSGTTSFPKPVLHTHQSLMVGVAGYADGIETESADKMLIVAPNYHVAGYLTLLMPHLRGAAVHLMEFYDVGLALKVIERERISMMFGFDVHYLMMNRHPHFAMHDISSLTKTMIGSSPGSYDEIKSMGITHHGNIYGSSEYVASQAYLPYRDRHDESVMRLSHGRPMLGTDLVIKDPATNRVLGPDQPGEICFKGPALFSGYYNMPEETAKSFDTDGYFHSGDYGWVDQRGYVYYRGRFKETIKSGGENVSAQEVELFLQMELPWILKAMVVAVPDPKWGEAVTAVVQLKPEVDVDEEGIREACRGKLAGYKIPKHVIFVSDEDWVATPTGKFDRGAMTSLALRRMGIQEPSQ